MEAHKTLPLCLQLGWLIFTTYNWDQMAIMVVEASLGIVGCIMYGVC